MRSLALLVAFWAVPLEAQEIGALPLSIAVAQTDGGPAVDPSWLDAQVDNASRIFTPFGVCFRRTRVRELDADHAALETRADRHALGGLLESGMINVFVVASLRDVDDPTRMRMGVHWRPLGHPGKHFVIISRSAMPTTLAHELGHFFGNAHSHVPGNVMSYEGRSALSAFDAAQGRRISAHARRFLRTGELRLVPGERCD
jgi:hypothetical protein